MMSFWNLTGFDSNVVMELTERKKKTKNDFPVYIMWLNWNFLLLLLCSIQDACYWPRRIDRPQFFCIHKFGKKKVWKYGDEKIELLLNVVDRCKLGQTSNKAPVIAQCKHCAPKNEYKNSEIISTYSHTSTIQHTYPRVFVTVIHVYCQKHGFKLKPRYNCYIAKSINNDC